MSVTLRYVSPEWQSQLVARVAEQVREQVREDIPVAELLYLTTDPCEVPLVMPTWARQVPELAALIDEGLKRLAEYPDFNESWRP